MPASISKGKSLKDDIKLLPTQRVDEFGTVARSISQLSENLKDQIKIIAKQRDQFGLVLDDLGEGILVTNRNRRCGFYKRTSFSYFEHR